ncbi:MAG: hypothetical protein KGN84_21970 [Acidobacteriota bacterium]|nr:hypothetical protein [Acidobacteriota bacterium]
MTDLLKLLLFFGGYFVLMRWILPAFGIPTCMSGSCSLPAPREKTENKDSETHA